MLPPTCLSQHLPSQRFHQHICALAVANVPVAIASVPVQCPCLNTQMCPTDSVTDVLAGVPGTAGALNGVALQATFGGIQGIAIAANGDVYVAEYRQVMGGLGSPCNVMNFAIAPPHTLQRTLLLLPVGCYCCLSLSYAPHVQVCRDARCALSLVMLTLLLIDPQPSTLSMTANHAACTLPCIATAW